MIVVLVVDGHCLSVIIAMLLTDMPIQIDLLKLDTMNVMDRQTDKSFIS